MKLKFKRDVLSKALSFVRNAIPRKEIEPILNSLDLKAISDKSVQIISTDYDLMAVYVCDCEVLDFAEDSVKEMTIPAERLISLVSKLAGDFIEMNLDGSNIFISCGSYKGEFKTAGTEGYPDIYNIASTDAIFSFKRETVLNGFRRIDFAVNSDEAKKNLMAIQVSKNGMVASNGSVTAVYREKFEVNTFCISSNCLSDLISVMAASSEEDIKIFEEESYLVFKFGDNIFFTRKTSANFPDIFDKIDKPTEANNKEKIKFKIKDLKAVLQRVSLTAPEETRSVQFEILTNDTLKISARDTKDFSSEETISYVGDGLDISSEEPIILYFNYALLLEILNKMAGEEIELKMNIKNIRTPIRVDEASWTVFLMRSAG